MEDSHFEKLNFEGSGTFNLYEYLYNLALCHIMNGNLMKALKCLKSILERSLSERVKHEIEVFVQFLQNEMKTALQGVKSIIYNYIEKTSK